VRLYLCEMQRYLNMVRSALIVYLFLLSTSGALAQRNNHRFCSSRHEHKTSRDYYSPENLRSDTLDILRYTINLDLTQTAIHQIKGACTIDMASRMDNISLVHLDLLALIVDSVEYSGGDLGFIQSGEELYITLPSALNEGDNFSLTVYYHGDPATDTSWGGFYTNSPGFAYNLGVAFDASPHNFGRVWFPCFDNFVERSDYEVHALTSGGRSAYCGGILTGVDTVGTDSLLSHWVLEGYPIPSYLASVAAANYKHVVIDDSYLTANGEEIPVWLTALPGDTSDMKSSFSNLLSCMNGFEERFGPYRWPRVGFVSVPFNGGAMEHATNIAYPAFAINGALTYETLYAHELSHHWWGDLVTCRTAEDMWLNEGWASYSEAIFEEWIYGLEAYRDYVASNHKHVLTKAFIDDGDRYPVSGIPHELTYGTHVYQKGADMVHNLRGVMGDEAFFNACREYAEAFQFKDASSEDLRDFFQHYTDVNLTDFFDAWIFAPGYPEFRVESSEITPAGNEWQINLMVRQYRHFAPEYYTGLPLIITLLDGEFNSYEQEIVINGEWTPISFTSPVEPAQIILNREQSINYAVLAEERFLSETGSNDFNHAEIDIDLNSIGSADSIWLRIENHWAPAELPTLIPFTEYMVAADRWWLIQSNMPEDASLDATIRFYGNPMSGTYYDPEFFPAIESFGRTEDDLVILYRENGMSEWSEWLNFEVSPQGSTTNWNGRIEIFGLRPGQYCWGIKTGQVEVPAEYQTPVNLSARSLGNGKFRVESRQGIVELMDIHGRLMRSEHSMGEVEMDLGNYPAGIYLFRMGYDAVRVYKE